VRLSKNVFGTLSATAHSSDGGLSRSTVVLGLMRRDIGPFEWVFARAFTSGISRGGLTARACVCVCLRNARRSSARGGGGCVAGV
jgi:hypothetical protein